MRGAQATSYEPRLPDACGQHNRWYIDPSDYTYLAQRHANRVKNVTDWRH